MSCIHGYVIIYSIQSLYARNEHMCCQKWSTRAKHCRNHVFFSRAVYIIVHMIFWLWPHKFVFECVHFNTFCFAENNSKIGDNLSYMIYEDHVCQEQLKRLVNSILFGIFLPYESKWSADGVASILDNCICVGFVETQVESCEWCVS